MNKKWFMVFFAMILTIGILAGCSGGKDESAGGDSKSDGKGSVYYLNFKPEIADQIEQMAKDFEKETGIKVTMTTAAGGTYESTLKAEISKSDAPTIFFINGPIGYQNWKDYTLDLSDTDLNKWLLDKDLAIKGEDGGVYGIPIAVEGYGIIYNKSIMGKYFASPKKSTDYKSMDEIKNFDALKAVVEDMTKLKGELGIDGVFSSTSLASGDQWRWTTHTANLPIYYEYRDKNVKELDKVDFTYADQYKNIFDLYINNSVVKPTLLGSKTTDDSMAEFALGKSAMVQNGNWAWNQISNVDGNVVKAEDIGFLPIYTGVKGEEKQGLAIGTENYLAINAKASKEDIEASKKFIDWMFNSEKGKDYVVNKFGFIPTFSTFGDDEIPTDPLAQAVIADMNNTDTTAVDWNFVSFPSENFKNEFGNSLLLYAQGQEKWNTVVDTFIKSWESEMSLKK
ncbi:ABC transporter substrate-binding protein [Bacillus andreraoultii]|uniref:ABC transporter substrate-binding protein n=1 Tax=Bacillus andreraoultii TaxID=1499685 RepID=UPI00053A3082|nr:ABC transporter substrate-binding protein [Bacillus andreraoultii]